MYKKIYSFFILCITCVLPLFGSDAKIIVGTNAEFPPFTFIDKGEVVGFDIDVAKEVCKRLGKEMQLKDMPFDALVPELTLGYVQFVAAGMSHTEERAKRVLFTKSYGSNDPLVILTLTKKMSLDDLTGKTVVVNEGFTADLFMSSKPGITLVRLSTPVDAFLALKAGRADAYVTAKSTIQQFMDQQKGVEFQWTPIENTEQGCSLVISKKYPELLDKIQGALDEMIQDGTMTTLKTKWKLS